MGIENGETVKKGKLLVTIALSLKFPILVRRCELPQELDRESEGKFLQLIMYLRCDYILIKKCFFCAVLTFT